MKILKKRKKLTLSYYFVSRSYKNPMSSYPFINAMAEKKTCSRRESKKNFPKNMKTNQKIDGTMQPFCHRGLIWMVFRRISSTDLKFRVTNNLEELKQGPANVSVKSPSRCIFNWTYKCKPPVYFLYLNVLCMKRATCLIFPSHFCDRYMLSRGTGW